MSEKKLNVVWICSVSNPQIYAHVKFGRWQGKNIAKFLLGKPRHQIRDRGQWNTNAIREFEKMEDVKLTVILPYDEMNDTIQKFTINGVDYICYRPDDDNLPSLLLLDYGKKIKKDYSHGREIVRQLIAEINPGVVHVIGAENPRYSICALDVPSNIPCVVSLQTLMSEPSFKENYPIADNVYQFRSSVERQVLQRSDYIASRIGTYNDYIRKNIKGDAVFLRMPLAIGVDVDLTPARQEYDFIYFANDISKAVDDAVEAFALACKKFPQLTLNISGYYKDGDKAALDKRLQELGIDKQIFITGAKQTHDEVLVQIKKSRFAVIPLKVDLVSSTIREAMACGLPVVTTITPGTPKLNEVRESVLLSEKGDFQAMADNMIRLVEDNAFAAKIRENALQTVREKYSNEAFMQMWRKAYYEIIENFHHGMPFSSDVLLED